MIQVSVRREFREADVLEGIKRFMQGLSEDRFFGVVQVQFVDGAIALVRKEESFKPASFLVVE